VGSATDFARAASLLRGAQFDEPTLLRLFGIETMADVGSVRQDQLAAVGAQSATLLVLVRLFLFLEAVPRQEIEALVDADVLASLSRLDLIREAPGPDGTAAYCAPVLLYPVADLLIASDRQGAWDSSGTLPPPDVVFPAIFVGTLRFLRVISKTPARDALDLCAGTGIGALVLSRHVQHVVSADITARASHFTQFNRLLNDRENVEVVQGDLYEPVRDRTFDRIVAHPPYVPAFPRETQVYRDGGETGEIVLQRIVEGLPRHLRPGGTFYAVSAGWDSAVGPFETRVRRWLGDQADEFDVIFAQHEELKPEQLSRLLVQKARVEDPGLDARWRRQFADAGLERNVYGAIAVHRAASGPAGAPRRAITARTKLSSATDGACFEAALRWHRWRATQEDRGTLAQALLETRPRLGSSLRARVTYAPRDGRLGLAEALLEADRPFRAATGIDPWMLKLVARFDGTQPAAAVYRSAREAAELPDGFGPEDFATLVGMMIERGYVEVEGV